MRWQNGMNLRATHVAKTFQTQKTIPNAAYHHAIIYINLTKIARIIVVVPTTRRSHVALKRASLHFSGHSPHEEGCDIS